VTDDLVYWADACTASTGTRFDGYGYLVAADGTVYFSADRDNGIYKIKPN
jgi:hypothetical protein